MRRAGIWLTWIGVVIMIGSIAGGTVLAVQGFRSLAGFTDSEIHVSGPGNSLEHHFDAGQEMQFFTHGANGVYVGPTPRCDVSGPGLVEDGTAMRSSVTIGSRSRISFDSVVFTESGVYQITCDQSGVTLAPPLSAWGIIGGVGGMMLAVFGGVIGFLLLIPGIILWVMGKRRQSLPPPSAD